jgi:hypothetical protein
LKMKSIRLLLLFPLLQVMKSYCIVAGRIVGGLKCGVLSV